MRPSHIWFAIAAAWALDFFQAQYRHNRTQAALAAFIACCFLGAALVYRKREQKSIRRKPAP